MFMALPIGVINGSSPQCGLAACTTGDTVGTVFGGAALTGSPPARVSQ